MDVCIHSLFVHAHVHGSAPSVHTRACRYSATTVCPPLIFWTHPGPYVHIRTCVFTLPTYVHARVRTRCTHPCRWCIHSSSQPLPPPPPQPAIRPSSKGRGVGGDLRTTLVCVYTPRTVCAPPCMYVHPRDLCASHVCLYSTVRTHDCMYTHPEPKALPVHHIRAPLAQGASRAP